ncbi:MAG: LacI family DNA-binding transcriptional regulator [Leifsonia sp.]|uniref:LacI family DNA-binding transcriptional regulator n=1 Tax=Leifsonia sp. TaxID=1870902 RepID=UPI003F812EAB
MAATPRIPSRVTAAMVAERAGTSVATVSLVVNGKHRGRVSDENAERVRAAVRELGYVVDGTASALARGTSDVVVLLAPDLPNPYFGRVIQGVQEELDDRFQLLLSAAATGRQPTATDVRRLAALRPAGLLVSAPGPDFLDEVPPGIPLVLLDAPGLESRAVAVNYDIEPGVDALVAHLAERGHRRIGYLDGTTPAATYILRREALARRAADRGMTVFADEDARSGPDSVEAAAVAARVLPRWRAAGVTAIVAAADTLALGVLAACADAGLRIPDDLAVAGFDDLPASAVTAPSLTSVALPGDALGREAAHRLIALLDGEGPREQRPGLLDATLIVRASTSAPAPRPSQG